MPFIQKQQKTSNVEVIASYNVYWRDNTATQLKGKIGKIISWPLTSKRALIEFDDIGRIDLPKKALVRF